MKNLGFVLLMLGICLESFCQNINRVEYFIDQDPGHGNGIEITGYTTSSSAISDYTTVIDASNLNTGIHQLFIRTKVDNGHWSITNNQLFFKMDPPNVSNISRMEYFFDQDPGHGNGNEITGYTAGNDIVNLTTALNATGLSQGLHTLFVRSKNDWSITAQQLFLKQDIPALNNLSRLEYFFDQDPGHGNGTEITGYTAGNDIVNFTTALNATGLSQGLHTLFVRSKNDWSITAQQLFLKQDIETLANVVAIEYFFDNDPGHGNGTAITIVPSSNLVDQVYSINFDGLTNGQHYIYIRTKNVTGEWSITQAQLINKNVQVTLPLNWLSFEAKVVSNNKAQLNWTTASELNTSHFEVEKSRNAIEFANIGIIKSNSQLNKNYYEFIDSKVNEGFTYYRIKQIDIDGKYSYSSIKQVNNENNKYFTIKNNGSSSPSILVNGQVGSIIIFNSIGKIVYTQNISKSMEFKPLENHLPAIYLAIFEENGQVISTKKIIKK